MTTLQIADELVCYCTKCKLELNHRITRVEADRPKRVLCLTCSAEHAFRKTPAVKKPRTPRPPSSQAVQESEWRAKLEKRTKTTKAYAMDKTFLLNDHIEHQLFGVGLVVSLIHPDKIGVFFQDGLKTMKCGHL